MCARTSPDPDGDTHAVRAVVQRVEQAQVSGSAGADRRRAGRACLSCSGSRRATRPDDADAARAQGRAAPDLRERRRASSTARSSRPVARRSSSASSRSSPTRPEGNRPGFSRAARPEVAEPLYERFCAALAAVGVPVATGVFGAPHGGRARQRRAGHDRPRLTRTSGRACASAGRPVLSSLHRISLA